MALYECSDCHIQYQDLPMCPECSCRYARFVDEQSNIKKETKRMGKNKDKVPKENKPVDKKKPKKVKKTDKKKKK